MDVAPSLVLSAGDGMPWVRITMDQTDRVCALITPELAEHRATDPTGRYFFSLGELTMHIADARNMFAGQLDGEDYSAEYWSARQGPDSQGVWEFKKAANWQEVLDSLRRGRERLEKFLEVELNRLYEPTDGTRKFYKEHAQYLRDIGRAEQAQSYERRGAATIARTLSAMACHEAGHRGSLQTLLRLKGVNAE